MSDLITTFRARVEEREARDEELRSRLKEFDTLLQEAAGKRDVPGNSVRCNLEEYGDGECSYGYLTFQGTLQVAYRTTEDDFSDYHGGPESQFRLTELDKCEPVWLRALAVPKVMDSLVTSLISKLETDIADSARGVRSVEAAAKLPSRELGSAWSMRRQNSATQRYWSNGIRPNERLPWTRRRH